MLAIATTVSARKPTEVSTTGRVPKRTQAAPTNAWARDETSSIGAIAEDHIVAEIGEVAAGLAEGRRSGDEITLFKSLGLAIEF